MEVYFVQIKKVKLEEIATVITGLPLQRYIGKDDAIKQQVIQTMPFFEIGEKFETQEADISEDIKDRFYSQEHDILYKVQQPSFAKEITTETGAIISNNYIIIRVDSTKVNSTFLSCVLLSCASSIGIISVSQEFLKNCTYLSNVSLIK